MKVEVADRVVGDDEVGPAVAVRVADDDAERFADGGGLAIGAARFQDVNARGRRDLFELLAIDIAKELALNAGELLRRYVGPRAAGEDRLHAQIEGRRPREVVAHEQIEPAIAVVVQERGR